MSTCDEEEIVWKKGNMLGKGAFGEVSEGWLLFQTCFRLSIYLIFCVSRFIVVSPTRAR
jgi:hypothetical protein